MTLTVNVRGSATRLWLAVATDGGGCGGTVVGKLRVSHVSACISQRRSRSCMDVRDGAICEGEGHKFFLMS